VPGSRLWADLLQTGYTERQLLDYLDFSVQTPEFRKHAWRSRLRLSEVAPDELSTMVSSYYARVEGQHLS
jgi:hypothetical protein